jgi:DNA-directed RNA polymerase subunit RPC12/RpoP
VFVPIRTYDNYIPANLVMQRLEAEEITAYLQDENTVTVSPMYSMAVGGIKLMVPEEQAPRALELLKEWETEYKEAAACPKCGSHNILLVPQAVNPTNWVIAIATWFFGNYAVSAKEVYKCHNCGHEFENIP